MKFRINNSGAIFFKRRKNNIYQYIFLSPIYLVIMSFIFIGSAENKSIVYLGIALLVFLLVFILIGFIKNIRTFNRVIFKVNFISSNQIKICTNKILFLKRRTILLSLNDVKINNQEIVFTPKEKEEGCKIISHNGKTFYLVWSHFAPELKELLTDKNYQET